MIAHCEAPKRTKAIRAKGIISREEYLTRTHEFAKRGKDLPQTRLTQIDIREIREAAIKRDELRRHITETMSNEALAKKYNTHPRNIEKILRYETHVSV